MVDFRNIDDLAHKLGEKLPDSVRAVREDVEQQFRAVLKSGLEKLELVTREEFDAQRAVLARTRERLEELEKRLADMEERDIAP